MSTYGQYCPIAMATEILGDRWTLLIVRDLLTGVSHFNDLARGLPGISRGLLSDRLSRLESAGIVRKTSHGPGRKTVYSLTAAGRELDQVINALLLWGARWAFDEPREDQLDPLLLMWWMRSRVRLERIPKDRFLIRYDFQHKRRETYWLLIEGGDASICLTDPGFETDILVTANLAAYFQVWMGRLDFEEAVQCGDVVVDAPPRWVRDFSSWFTWSLAAPAVREVRLPRS